MKKITLLKMMLLALVILASSVKTFSATITITGADMTTTDGAQSITKSGIGFNGFMKQYSTTKIWFTSGTGYIYNTTSLGSITKITLSYNVGGSATAVQRFNVGSSAMSSYMSTGGTTVSASTGGTTYDYTGGVGSGFFNISVSSKNLQLVSLVIEYTPTGGSPAATPTFSPAAGTYTSAQSVTLSSTTSGALIYYTTNGVDPTSASTLYTGAINVATTTTLKAIAYDSSNANASSVATALYTINIATAAATPTFSPAAGTYTSAQSVTLSSATSGALIYYTTNGVDPTSASTLYTGAAINVASTTTLKAIAYDSSNANPSSVATATYTIVVPTITVTETSIPSMTAIVGETDSETINVSGANLTENIAIAITGTDAGMFSVSPTSITQTGGTATNTLVTITYAPTAAGSHTATLQLTSAGAATVTRTLTGTATFTPLSTPVATAATSVGQTSFTANWETVTGATSYQLNVYKQTTGANASDLFISEYGEGSGGNKKYVEIYNGTGSSVDLANYTIKKSVNGAGWNVSVYSFPTSTSLANNSTYVLANNSTDVLGANEYNSTFVTWNGDDAVGLFKNDVLIDVFGTPSTDPGTGWAVAGITNATVDHIIIRKPSVNSPSTDWTTSAGTTVEDSQWTVSSSTYTTTDQTTNLGSHTMSGGVSTTPVSGSPFTVSAPATSYSVTGLTTSTTYYYDLTASNTNVTTSLSNTISVTTGTGTGVDKNTIENISASNGKIKFDAIAGDNIEIYNSIGQKLINKKAVEGLNTIELPSVKGIIIVKIGNKTAKVVL